MVAKCGMFSCLIPTTSGCLPNKSALKCPFFLLSRMAHVTGMKSSQC